MSEIFVDGVKFHNIRAFLCWLKVPEKKQRALYKSIRRVIDQSDNIWIHGNRPYYIRETPLQIRNRTSLEKTTAAPEPEASTGSHRLLARNHATVGLHQDKGDHYA